MKHDAATSAICGIPGVSVGVVKNGEIVKLKGYGLASSYALGWSVGRHGGRRVVGHEGGGAAWVAHFPDEQLSIIVLANLNGARADEMQYGIADIFLPK